MSTIVWKLRNLLPPSAGPAINAIEAEIDAFMLAGAMPRDLGVAVEISREPYRAWYGVFLPMTQTVTWRLT